MRRPRFCASLLEQYQCELDVEMISKVFARGFYSNRSRTLACFGAGPLVLLCGRKRMIGVVCRCKERANARPAGTNGGQTLTEV